MTPSKRIWPAALSATMLLVFLIQLSGYLLAVREVGNDERGDFYKVVLIHQIQQVRHKMATQASRYVDTGDARHRDAYETEAGIQDAWIASQRQPNHEPGHGRSGGLDPGNAVNPLIRTADHAEFGEVEHGLIRRLVDSLVKLSAMEREAMRRAGGAGSLPGILSATEGGRGGERGGLDGKRYLDETQHAARLMSELHDDALQGGVPAADEWTVFGVNWNAWAIGLGLLQSAAVFSLFSFHRLRLTRMERRAYHDSLTELPNRWYLDMYLEWVCSRAVAHGEVVILAFIDLNGFKPINDTLGHDHGDYVLKYIADSLHANCRAGDIVSRFGGDEFVVVFVVPANQCSQSMERLRELVHRTFDDACSIGEKMGFGASVGISIFPSKASSPEILVQTADEAMYRAKAISKATQRQLVIMEYEKNHVATGHAAHPA